MISIFKMKNKSYDRFFINFANRERLRILYLLKEKPLSVNEIIKALGEEQSRVSHNLRKLWACNLVNVKKEGKKRVYSLNNRAVLSILSLAKEHVNKFCSGECKKDEIQKSLSR